jgi:hypothetical protein
MLLNLILEKGRKEVCRPDSEVEVCECKEVN